MGAQGGGVYQHGVGVTFDLVLLAVLVEEVLGDLVGLPLEGVGTFSFVMISSSSRLTWKSTSQFDTLP